MEPSQESRSTSKLIPLRSSRKNSRPGKPRPETEFQEKRLEPRPAANSMPPAAEKTTAKISGFPQLGLPGDANPDTLPPQLQRPDMIKVEEISDTLQEVEFWMLLNDRSRALEILEPLGKVEKPDSPAPWLYLLDTYADMGDQAKYEALRERCERIFNVRIAKWEDKDIVVSSRGLEEFPHLMEQICKRWKGNQVVKFLENLLVDDRDGARAGFELPAYRDLMLLISLAKDIEPPKPVPESAAA
jgi:hypothetical protein